MTASRRPGLALFFRRRLPPITGDIATFTFRIDTDHSDGLEADIYGSFRNQAREIHGEIASAVAETLGSQVEVRDLAIRRGSVEVIVVIAAAYYVIAAYPDFLQGLDKLFEQIRSILRRFAGRFSQGPWTIVVSGSWKPSAGVQALHSSGVRRTDFEVVLLVYILVTHAVLLGIFVWKFLRT